MDQPLAVYRQLTPPTACQHAVGAWLTRPRAPGRRPELVLALGPRLEIWQAVEAPREGVAGHVGGGADGGGRSGAPPRPSLRLLHSQDLFGVVESMAVLPAPTGGVDAVVLTFREAKVSVLHWDPAVHAPTTSSLHYLEGDAALRRGRAHFARAPLALADPGGRCAAALAFGAQLAVLPAMGAFEDDRAVELALLGGPAGSGPAGGGPAGAPATPTPASVGNAYVASLEDEGVSDAISATFLHSTGDPSLAILHEPEPTAVGMLRARRDTCAVTVLSLDLVRREHPRAWRVDGLPSDSARLEAAPRGGALLLCLHAVLHLRQGPGRASGVVLHSLGLAAPRPPPPLDFSAGAAAAAAAAPGGKPSDALPGAVAGRYAAAHQGADPREAPDALRGLDARRAGWDLEVSGGARVTWPSEDAALLALPGGQVLGLRLDRARPGAREDDGRAPAAAFKLGAGPVPRALCSLGDDLAFLGSASGNSLLLGVWAGGVQAAGAAGDAGTPSTPGGDGAGRVGGGAAAAATAAAYAPAADLEGPADADDDEAAALFLYGDSMAEDPGAAALAGAAAPAPTRRLALSVLDSLPNAGPARSLTLARPPGEPPSFVAACGRGRAGALAVLRPGLAPDVLTSVPLGDVLGLWTLRGGGGPGDAAPPGDRPSHHAHLLISGARATKVLRTGEELTEISREVDFALDARTLDAGGCGGFAAQALASGVRVLRGTSLLRDHWAVELARTAVAGPAGGEGTSGGAAPAPPGQAAPAPPPGGSGALVVSAQPGATGALSAADASARLAAAHVSRSGVLALLAGGAAAALRPAAGGEGLERAPLPAPFHSAVSAVAVFEDASGWLAAAGEAYAAAAFDDGSLLLASLRDGRVAFSARGLGAGEVVLEHRAEGGAGPGGAPALADEDAVTDLAVESFEGGPPFLLSLTRGGLARAYVGFRQGGGDRGARAFRRLALALPPLLPEAAAAARAAADGAAAPPGPAPGPAPPLAPRSRRLVRFDGLGEDRPWAGLAVLGARPHALVATRGTLAPHPLTLPARSGGLVGAASFHNVNCPHGLLLATDGEAEGPAGPAPRARGERAPPAPRPQPPSLHICQLPPRTALDSAWPVQRIPLGATPVAAAFHATSGTVATVTERPAPYSPMTAEEPGSEPHAAYAYALREAIARGRGQSLLPELRVLRAGSWEPLGRPLPLEPGERALCLESLQLQDAARGGEALPVLALGLGLPVGEDYPCTGRVALFGVLPAGRGAGANGRPGAGGGAPAPPAWSPVQLVARAFRGPVTSLRALEGLLLVATGNRLEACTVASEPAGGGDPDAPRAYRIDRVAFYDGPLLLTTLHVIKSFVLTGAVKWGLEFLRYNAQTRAISQLGRDYDRSDIVGSELLLAGSKLNLLAADGSGTLRLLTYAPASPESWGGRRLVPWAAFHLGAFLSASLRFDGAEAARAPAPFSPALLATSGGALSAVAIAPAAGDDPALARRAARLAVSLAAAAPAAAGLNPLAFRARGAVAPPGAGGTACITAPPEHDAVVDGDLLSAFVMLPAQDQRAVAAAAGCGRRQALAALDRSWELSAAAPL